MSGLINPKDWWQAVKATKREMWGPLSKLVGAGRASTNCTRPMNEASMGTAEMVDKETGNTVLHHAACDPDCPEKAMLELVAAWPAAAAHTDSGGSVPLHLAGRFKLPPKLVRTLLEANPAAVHLKAKDGNTPLDYAIEGGAPEASVALLRAATQVKAPPTRHDNSNTPQSDFTIGD